MTPISMVPDDDAAKFNVPTMDEDEGLHISGSESFDDFGASLPNDARSFLEDVTPADEGAMAAQDEGASLASETTPAARKAKRIKMSRGMKKQMDKLKGKVATLPAKWFDQQAKIRPEWALDEDERDIIKDSIETVFEVLDIEIAIEPLELTFTSIWWVLSYPVVAFLFLFLSKKSLVMDHVSQEEPPS